MDEVPEEELHSLENRVRDLEQILSSSSHGFAPPSTPPRGVPVTPPSTSTPPSTHTPSSRKSKKNFAPSYMTPAPNAEYPNRSDNKPSTYSSAVKRTRRTSSKKKRITTSKSPKPKPLLQQLEQSPSATTSNSNSNSTSMSEIPWARMQTQHLHQHQLTSPEVFSPTSFTSLPPSASTSTRPLLLAKKLYGHLVNLQQQHSTLKHENDHQLDLIGHSQLKLKKQANIIIRMEEENKILHARLRVTSHENERKARLAQKSVFRVLKIFDAKTLSYYLKNWRAYTTKLKSNLRKQIRHKRKAIRNTQKQCYIIWVHHTKTSLISKRKINNFVLRSNEIRNRRTLQVWTEKLKQAKADNVTKSRASLKVAKKLLHSAINGGESRLYIHH